LIKVKVSTSQNIISENVLEESTLIFEIKELYYNMHNVG